MTMSEYFEFEDEDTPITHKYCGSCDQTKPIGEFWRDRTKKDGYVTYCKLCRVTYAGKWKQRREQVYREGAKRNARRGHLQKRYGMSVEQYDKLRDSKGGMCFACGCPPAHILQGDFCRMCNTMCGFLCEQCKYRRKGLSREQAATVLKMVQNDHIRTLARYVVSHRCKPNATPTPRPDQW